MKAILTVAVLSTLGLSASASAAEYGDVATVISSTPVYERVSAPRRECYNEQVSTYDERRVRRANPDAYAESRGYSSNSEGRGVGAGAVLGAILGGVVGHQFGNSSGGRDRGTAAGALIGGLIGHDIERNKGDSYSDSNYRRAAYDVERVPVTREVQRCNVVNDYREEVRGYDVRYRYGNREYTTRLAYDPGPTMPVSVDVRPSYRAPAPGYAPVPAPSYNNRYLPQG